jgi:hypothetical protein
MKRQLLHAQVVRLLVMLASAVACGAFLSACASILGDYEDTTTVDVNGDASTDTTSGVDTTPVVETASDGGSLDSSSGDGDSACALHEHQCPSLGCWCPIGSHGCPPPGDAASHAKYFSCLPTGNTADPSTYSAALIDEQIAHVEASDTRTWSRFSFSCSGQPCVGLSYSGTSGSAPYYEAHLWCNTGTVIGRSGGCSATGSTSCTPACNGPTSGVAWW